MNTIQIKNFNIRFCSFEISDLDALVDFLLNLSDESKKRFGPHKFSKETINQLYNDKKNYKLFIAKTEDDNAIIAYTIIKMEWLDFEYPRLNSYGLNAEESDCTIAPSVADEWQGRGLGGKFLAYLITEMKTEYKIKRIFLWGGVQSDNAKAVNLYQKLGFKTLGEFEYNGVNQDMFLDCQ